MRYLRPYLPGGVFHVTARTLNKEHWLEDTQIREFALEALCKALDQTDANLIAFAVMTNHLHLVVRQGGRPIGQLMQPLLRRIARRIQKAQKRSGRIFGNRYWSEPCTDPEYMRRIILYTNVNPQKAKICSWDDDYCWSSHSAYLGQACTRSDVRANLEKRLALTLNVFANRNCDSLEKMHRAYRRHVARERHRLDEDPRGRINLITDDGDEFWSNEFAHRMQDYGKHPRPALSVREIATAVLKKKLPGYDVDWLNATQGSKQVVEARHEIIERALQLGHRSKSISTSLCVSEATVSKVRTRMAAQTFVRFAPFPKTNV